jgi:hypothetical protein
LVPSAGSAEHPIELKSTQVTTASAQFLLALDAKLIEMKTGIIRAVIIAAVGETVLILGTLLLCPGFQH